MPKQIATVDVSSFTTDAKFRAWGLAMSTALQACGLVKTSDTGQIDWTTVTKPVATNTQAGYEVYRFNDSLQATKPIFIRVGYGSGGVASGNSPTTWMTVGTSTNGSGTITGTATNTVQGYTVNSAANNTGMNGFFTHTSNGYCYMNFGQGLSAGSTSNAGVWVVQRTVHPTTGVATGDGAVMMPLARGSGAISHAQYELDFNIPMAYNGTATFKLGLPANSHTLSTANGMVFGKQYMMGGAIYPLSGMLNYWFSDAATFSDFQAAPYGMTHTYRAFGAFLPSLSPFGNSYPSVAGAVIWED